MQYDPRDGHSTTTCPPLARRATRLGAPRRARHRLRYRRTDALPQRRRPAALRECGRHRAGLFTIILMFGPVSGGHFNPVVSLADASFGGLAGVTRLPTFPRRSPAACSAPITANVMFCARRCQHLDPSPRLARTPLFRGDRDRRALLVIFSLARTKRRAPAPAAIGAYIGAAYFFTELASFANPAITVGRSSRIRLPVSRPPPCRATSSAQLLGGACALLSSGRSIPA